ncbi:hypothetical protein OUZ56_025121 [Daphnia magna]|uniref:Uncharacterized protein n=1 Tax=Daphnia magna TaxID=35525 RepID=A0ABQ9ZIX3_9CRUS|nr:hypothetical protein OUZ56_025121 [Daphnia magna]
MAYEYPSQCNSVEDVNNCRVRAACTLVLTVRFAECAVTFDYPAAARKDFLFYFGHDDILKH